MNEREKRVRELEDAIADAVRAITEAKDVYWNVTPGDAAGDDDIIRGAYMQLCNTIDALRDLIRVPEPQQRQVIGADVPIPPTFGQALRDRQALREMARLLALIPHQLTLNACPKCYGRMEAVPVSLGFTVGSSVATGEYVLPLRCANPQCDGVQSTRDPTYQLTPPSYSNIPRPQTLDDVRAQLEATSAAMRKMRDEPPPQYLTPKPEPQGPWVPPPGRPDPAIVEIRQQMHAAIEKLLHARCERCGGPMQIRTPDDPTRPYVIPLRCAGGCND